MNIVNCSKCGRIVGKDGFLDVSYDDYAGGYEMGYPLCGRCLREKQARLKAAESQATDA